VTHVDGTADAGAADKAAAERKAAMGDAGRVPAIRPSVTYATQEEADLAARRYERVEAARLERIAAIRAERLAKAAGMEPAEAEGDGGMDEDPKSAAPIPALPALAPADSAPRRRGRPPGAANRTRVDTPIPANHPTTILTPVYRPTPADAAPGQGLAGLGLLTPEQAGAILSVAPSRLDRWRRSGDGPAFVALGHGLVRYLEADLVEFLISRRRRPGVNPGC
jgi:hypothetical protein